MASYVIPAGGFQVQSHPWLHIEFKVKMEVGNVEVEQKTDISWGPISSEKQDLTPKCLISELWYSHHRWSLVLKLLAVSPVKSLKPRGTKYRTSTSSGI